MQGVVIESRPALELIEMHDDEGTLFYLDPPYLPETRDARSDYNFEMTVEDHQELLTAIKGIKGKVILSGYQSAMYADTLNDWRVVQKETHAEGARQRTEVLWMNFDQAPDLFTPTQTEEPKDG